MKKRYQNDKPRVRQKDFGGREIELEKEQVSNERERERDRVCFECISALGPPGLVSARLNMKSVTCVSCVKCKVGYVSMPHVCVRVPGLAEEPKCACNVYVYVVVCVRAPAVPRKHPSVYGKSGVRW